MVVWRQIEKRETYRTPSHPRGTYSVVYTLDCGHEQHRKGSQEPKGTRVRCRACEELQSEHHSEQ